MHKDTENLLNSLENYVKKGKKTLKDFPLSLEMVETKVGKKTKLDLEIASIAKKLLRKTPDLKNLISQEVYVGQYDDKIY